MSDVVATETMVNPESNGVIKLTLSRQEKKVDIEGQIYTIKEMTGSELDAWRSSVGARVTTDQKGNTRVTNFDKFTASLIAKCLYSPDDKPVPITVIANWPANAQRVLFKMCQDLNGLTEEAAEREKND